MIQVRNVPDDVHRTLKVRAASSGLSLSDYIKRDLVDSTQRPSLEELDARIGARPDSGLGTAAILSALREIRDD
jgi:plasmid stability protein